MGVESDGTAEAGFRLRCGALRLLSNDRTGEGENTYAAAWFGLTYFLCCGRPWSATEFGSPESLWVGTMGQRKGSVGSS